MRDSPPVTVYPKRDSPCSLAKIGGNSNGVEAGNVLVPTPAPLAAHYLSLCSISHLHWHWQWVRQRPYESERSLLFFAQVCISESLPYMKESTYIIIAEINVAAQLVAVLPLGIQET